MSNAPVVHPPTRQPLSLSARPLFVIFALELLAIDIARLPNDLYFDRFAFFDNGANLTLQYLTSLGLRPAIDFGYQYGLLAALVGRIWFGFFGATPIAYEFAMATGAILFAWAMAKIFAGRKIGASGLALLIVSLGFAFQSSYPNLAHCIEAVILSHALAAQVRGSNRIALALATLAVFDKPSMGYIFGAILLLLIALEVRRNHGTLRDFLDALIPAAIIFAVLSAILIAVYGARSFLVTMLPIEGVSLYREAHFGFINGPGRVLWNPAGRSLRRYFLDIPGFWMASTIYLIVAAIAQAWTYFQSKSLPRAGEVIITCAVLHLIFIFVLFGSGASWIYYSYLLAIGCALATETGKRWQLAAAPLCVLAILSWHDTAIGIRGEWKWTSPNASTANLWSAPEEATEWNKVLTMARQQKTIMIENDGAADLMFPEFAKPVTLYLNPGLRTPDEVARKVAQISTATAFVISAAARTHDSANAPPEISAAIKNFQLQWKGNFFEVYRRR